MSRAWIAIILFFLPLSSFAIVDMRSANFSDTWVDLRLPPGSGYELEIKRTYNSRTLFNGIFGFGWCSEFETRLEITAEGNLKLIECGGGQEIDYFSNNFSKKQVDATIALILKEVKKRNKDLDSKYMKKLKTDLARDTFLREEFARQLNLKGKIKSGVKYYASGRENETMVLKGNSYYRTLPDGTYQKFSSKGNMSKVYDRNSNSLTLNYKKGRLISVVDNSGRKLNFKYFPSNGKVKQITGPGGLKATYTFKGENLVGLKNAWKSKYTYSYDSLHNLTKINFPNNTTKVITYNKDRDWVTSFKDQAGCVEKYQYVGADKKVLDYYKSSVKKTCKGKVTNNSTFEFFNKLRPKGNGRYLYKAVSKINGKKTEIVYHEKFGKPLSVYRNGFRTRYKYNSNGYVKSKFEDNREMGFEYVNACKKVSKVTAKMYQWQKNKKSKKRIRKLARSINTNFKYDKKKCNLIYANNSLGQTVQLGYDAQGRIAHIKDQAKKIVRIKYNARNGKPSVVTRPGLGTITVKYKKNGEIANIDSKEGPSVAIQVASIFNNLLDIIAPATTDVRL